MKLFISEMKNTQTRKMNLLEKIVEAPENTEIELFFWINLQNSSKGFSILPSKN